MSEGSGPLDDFIDYIPRAMMIYITLVILCAQEVLADFTDLAIVGADRQTAKSPNFPAIIVRVDPLTTPIQGKKVSHSNRTVTRLESSITELNVHNFVSLVLY